MTGWVPSDRRGRRRQEAIEEVLDVAVAVMTAPTAMWLTHHRTTSPTR